MNYKICWHGLRGVRKHPGKKIDDRFASAVLLDNPFLSNKLPDHCFLFQTSMNAKTACVKMELLVSINLEITNANVSLDTTERIVKTVN